MEMYIEIWYNFKAIPHKDCAMIAQSDFSSDCQKLRRNTGVFQGVFSKNDGKYASRVQSPKGGLCAVLL